MRRTASEVLRSLEMRVARLERSRGMGRRASMDEDYLNDVGEILENKGAIVSGSHDDDDVMDYIEEYVPVRNPEYGAWFLTSKNHGEFEPEAQSANVGAYLVFAGGEWKAGMVWTGGDMGRSPLDPDEEVYYARARKYFNGQRVMSVRPTGDAETDAKVIMAMLKKI